MQLRIIPPDSLSAYKADAILRRSLSNSHLARGPNGFVTLDDYGNASLISDDPQRAAHLLIQKGLARYAVRRPRSQRE